MNEHVARDVVLARAIEVTDDAREIWSDADRMWAGRTAAETVGETAQDDAFLGQRAALVLERIGRRHPQVRAVARGSSARGWLAPAAVIGAFVIGVAGADIGPAHRINLLAPPVLALLVWNFAVYVALFANAVMARGRALARGGPLRRTVVSWLRDILRPSSRAVPRPLATALVRFFADWSALAAPLWRARAARLMHVSAAALAAGVIAGLYVRGVGLEYRAAWQSTFLDAADVARLLHAVLTPGSWLTGIPIPDAARLATIAGGSVGENAAPWIHLYAASLLLIVIAPRLALAALAGFSERRLARRFPLSAEEPYLQRLLRAWRQGTARVAAVAYSYDVPRTSAEGLARLLTRVLQSAVSLDWLPAVAYGADDVPVPAAAPLTAVVAVFNLIATPERDNHGAFARALQATLRGRAPLVAIVDTSDFVVRFGANPRRVDERRQAWHQMLAAEGIEPLFVRLGEPDLRAAATALTTHLEHARHE